MFFLLLGLAGGKFLEEWDVSGAKPRSTVGGRGEAGQWQGSYMST